MSDLLLYNGKIFTQDKERPDVNAILIRDGKVQAIGNVDEVIRIAGPGTPKFNLEGKRVIPGLTDAHIHVYEWALLQRGLDLDHTESLEEVLDMVRTSAGQKKAGEWIIGQGWNQEKWLGSILPSRDDLDRVAPDNPVILWRTDLHLAWVNSKALEAAHITRATLDPPMGVIDRNENGEPTGIIRELAINLVRDAMPPAGDNETDEAMRTAIGQLHQLGVTGVHDFRLMGGDDGPPALRAWQRLRNRGLLDIRAWVLIPGELLDQAVSLGLQSGFGDDLLRIGAAKYFADGSTGARTSWMIEPFEDGGSGMPLSPMDILVGAIGKAHRAGLSTAIHAIGDRAIRELLDVHTEILGKAEGHVQPRVPHRIEHVQHSQPDDLKRLAPLGLVASVQPIHATADYKMIEKACGKRAKWAYAFRDMLDNGTVLAFGSDCPVASPNPFWGIHAAVTRQNPTGDPKGGWNPAQRITVAEAVWAYTMGGAVASGQEKSLGSLSPGKLADLVVLDRDIFGIDPANIAETQVEMTIFDGRVVYRKE